MRVLEDLSLLKIYPPPLSDIIPNFTIFLSEQDWMKDVPEKNVRNVIRIQTECNFRFSIHDYLFCIKTRLNILILYLIQTNYSQDNKIQPAEIWAGSISPCKLVMFVWTVFTSGSFTLCKELPDFPPFLSNRQYSNIFGALCAHFLV